MEKVILYIKGMDCEDEARLIRAEMEWLKGVERYEINLISRSIKVAYDPSLISVQDILKAIARTGMEADLKKEEKVKRVGVWWREPRILTLSASGFIILTAFVLEHIFGISHEAAIILYGTATLIGGYYPAKMGLAALKTLTPNIRTLMVAGAVGAIALGFWEEAALLVLIYSFGETSLIIFPR